MIRRHVLGLAALVVVAAVGTGVAADPATPAGASGGCRSSAPRLTVTGTGSVTVTPDLLTLSLGVATTASSAAGALEAADTAATAVVGALESGGVAAKDLQTTGLSVEPSYGETGIVVTSYDADETVTAKLRDLATAGNVIDAAVSAGGDATRVDGLTLSLSNPASAQARARTLAVRQAAHHASAMASAAGERRGALCAITDISGRTVVRPIPLPVAASGAASPAVVPVEAGTQTVTAQVRLVYALAPARRPT